MDYMIRAAAADGQIRAFAATTRDMAEHARVTHGMTPTATAPLGRLLTGGVMMGSMMKGEQDLLTLQIRGDGPLGGIVVTADSLGHAKGYVHYPEADLPPKEKGKLDVGSAIGKGTLTVIRDLGLKEPYQGSCELQSGEIAEDLTYYFFVSEQVPSSVGLGVLIEPSGEVRQAGGFIIQLMPGVSDEVISALEKHLTGIRSVTQMLDSGMTPEDILEMLLGDFDLKITDKIPVSFQCNCSRQRIEKVLLSLGREELLDMAREDHPAGIRCQFCGTEYVYSQEELKALVEKCDA